MRHNIQYINGNYFVKISGWDKSYRALRHDDPIFRSEFPDSIDIKITNSCSIGCYYCHESSVHNGKHFNQERTKNILSGLPKVGIELAIGGGDILEIPKEELINFLIWCNDNKFLTRVTINIKDFLDPDKLSYINQLSDLVEAFGISIDNSENYDLAKLMLNAGLYKNKIVYHIIAGIFPISQLKDLLYTEPRNILILGYKNWGRGKYINPDLTDWKEKIAEIIYTQRSKGNCNKFNGINLSFDNLAIEQLDINKTLIDNEWSKFYMGPEFSHSMYVDAVSEVFAPTSRSSIRDRWEDWENNIVNYYKNNRIND